MDILRFYNTIHFEWDYYTFDCPLKKNTYFHGGLFFHWDDVRKNIDGNCVFRSF